MNNTKSTSNLQQLLARCFHPLKLLGQFFPAARHARILLCQFPTVPCTIRARDRQSCVQRWKDIPLDATDDFVIDRQRNIVREALVRNYIRRRNRSDRIISTFS